MVDAERLRRVGTRSGYRKEGRPDATKDQQSVRASTTTKRKQDTILSLSRCSAFSWSRARRYNDIRHQPVTVLNWLSVEDARRGAIGNPGQYASSFKQFFGHRDALHGMAVHDYLALEGESRQ